MKFDSILLLGPPGSGKGTQGKALRALPGFYHCSSGAVFRNLDPQSELAKTCSNFTSQGNLVPDDLTIKIWRDHMRRVLEADRFNPKKEVLLLDGIPRNVAQVGMIEPDVNILKVIVFEVSDEERMIQRLKKRARKQNRADDAAESIIRHRFEVYHDLTRPLLAQYPDELIAYVDAQPTPAEVLRDLLNILIPVTHERHQQLTAQAG